MRGATVHGEAGASATPSVLVSSVLEALALALGAGVSVTQGITRLDESRGQLAVAG